MTNRTCITCQEPLTGKQRAHCSRACAIKADTAKRRQTGSRRNYAHQRNCPICGIDFMGKSRQVYCSKQCQLDSCREQSMTAMQAAYSEWVLKKRAVEVYTGPPNPKPTWNGSEVKGGRTFVSGPCAWCGEQFTDRWAVARYCSRACGKRADAQRTWSRQGYFKPTPTLRREVARASNWTCHLCLLPIPPDATHQEPLALTLDHLVPQSLAAVPDHTPANLRAAHRQCNSVRGNKPIDSPEFYRKALTNLLSA